MSGIVNQRDLERVTGHDIRIRSRIARRAANKLGALVAARYRPRVWGPEANNVALETDVDIGGACLGGLEVHRNNSDTASQLRVTVGSLLLPLGALAVAETRPAGWTGTPEPDDGTHAVFDLVAGVTVAPSVVIAGALAASEWWIVYALPVVETVETDPTNKVFNEGTGVFDSSSQPKVTRHGLTITVARGASGQNLAHASLVLPAGAIQLAFVWVPSGATDLSGALIYDTRALSMEDPGPNTVETAGWTVAEGFTGQITSPFSSSTKYGFRGVVRARLNGEWLECRSMNGITLDDLAEPDATPWGTPSVPTLCYLYLCKVRGVVPRLVRIGNKPASTSTTAPTVIQSGVLVLSAREPQLRAGPSAQKAAMRWDLRNATAIKLPRQTFTAGANYEYDFSGCVAEVGEAICVGVAIYSAYDTVDLAPNVLGNQYTTRDGWVTGDAIVSGAAAIVDTNAVGATGTANMTATITIKSITSGGSSYATPFDAVRSLLSGTITGGGGDFIAWKNAAQTVEMPVTSGGVANYRHVGEDYSPVPGFDTFSTHSGSVAGQTFLTRLQQLTAVRFPYNEPLITGPISS